MISVAWYRLVVGLDTCLVNYNVTAIKRASADLLITRWVIGPLFSSANLLSVGVGARD